MKTVICVLLGFGISIALRAQSIVGSWQLVKETNCMEEQMSTDNDSASNMLEDMKSMSSPSAQVVTFKEKMTGEESTRVLTRKRSDNRKSFLYKFDGEMLLILDKKSQTITENFTVEKFTTDSLIISSSSRPCEIRVFSRIK